MLTEQQQDSAYPADINSFKVSKTRAQPEASVWSFYSALTRSPLGYSSEQWLNYKLMSFGKDLLCTEGISIFSAGNTRHQLHPSLVLRGSTGFSTPLFARGAGFCSKPSSWRSLSPLLAPGRSPSEPLLKRTFIFSFLPTYSHNCIFQVAQQSSFLVASLTCLLRFVRHCFLMWTGWTLSPNFHLALTMTEAKFDLTSWLTISTECP